ncbi:methyltransferase-domain-containing protein [Pterulicium gracile]|uniref:Ribosomal RNA-processing protein 8 n=1 Tax=Pterulicium gracile TaxID=1884261 RepID=A0A5C3QF39_9AGAR|nr:methyltransferase-domain-containing protein [Pterula gracilis]
MRSSAAEPEVVKTIEIEGDLSGAGLTKLQREMKEKLDGARFRQINEQLYKSESQASHELLRADPKVFEDYHTGFRHQVHSWPTNPVDTYATLLSSYPPKTIIADIGCGDAQLAKSLVKEGLNVLSFDLVASDYVVEADICRYIPLPGSAPEGVQTGAAIVDVVVCSLALMGTNWPGCVREAWRILKDEGELKIAEVSSRFTDMKKFIEVIKNVGFKLVSKDDSNTHFLMLEFVKDAKKTKLKSEADVVALMNRGSLLKACEYKKR